MGSPTHDSARSSDWPRSWGTSLTTNPWQPRPFSEAEALQRQQAQRQAQRARHPLGPRPFAPVTAGGTAAQESEKAPPPRFDLSGMSLFAPGEMPPPPPGWARAQAQVRLQAKLTVGAPDDAYEQEADRVAAQVMAMPEPVAVQRAIAPESESLDESLQPASAPQPETQPEESLQTQAIAATITPLVQRQELTLPPVPHYRLTPPSLLTPPDPASRYRLGGGDRLRLDPQLQTAALHYTQRQLSPGILFPRLANLSLGSISLTPPPAIATPLPQTPGRSSSSSPPPPPSLSPEPARAATPGDLLQTILAAPTIGPALTQLGTQAEARISSDWQRLRLGERVGVVSSLAVIGSGALTGVLATPDARRWVFDQFNGQVLPVPGVPWLRLEINTERNALMLGFHLDIGALLAPPLGFGPGHSWTAIGGPPQPESAPPMIQRLPKTTQPISPPSDLEERLSASKGGGTPLSSEVRSFMEPRFGADFSQVRVHTGESAVQMNREVGAKAFTHGTDIYFNSGKFEPDSAGGKELLAHELTHTIQQTGRRNLQRKELNRDRHKPQLSKLNLSQNDEDQNVEPNDETRQILSRDQVDLNKENKANLLTKTEPKPEVIANSPQALSEAGKPEQIPIGQTANLDPQSSIPKTPAQTPAVQPPKNAQGSEETAKNNIVDFGPSSVAKQNKADSSETKSFSPQPSPTPVATSFAQSMDVANNAGAAVTPPQFTQAQTVPTQGGTGAIASGSPGLEIPTASGAASTLDAGPSSTEASAVPEVGDDPELDAVVQETAGVELPTDAKVEASADLSAIGAEGGDAPTSIGGGGGGGAIADKPTPPTPDVSQSDDPAQALATVANLPPVQLQSALGGVGAAVDKSVNKEKTEIANNPPQMEVGAEGGSGSATDKVPSISAVPKAVEKAPEGQPKPTPEPKPLPNLPAPAKAAVTPAVQGGTDGKLSSQDVQNLQVSLNRLPTNDPAASTLRADAPPPLKLEGDANPQQAQEQRAKLESSVNETYTQGQKEVSQPLGEDQIKATVPKELIKAEAGGQTAAGAVMPAVAQAGGGAGGEAGADDGISVIAQEKHGAEIQAAVAQAQGQMATERQGHQAKVAQERQKSQEDINKLQADNAAEQHQEKLKAKAEADQLRSDWTKEQDQLVAQSRKEADDEVSKGNQEVQTEQVQAEQKAQQEIEAGNQKADVERQKGEQQAEVERQKGQKESSGGFFGWLADKAKAFFDGIKQGIQQAFEAARAAIKSAIEAAQKLATAAIEAGRKAIVGIIRRVSDKLIALGDKLLANFPQVRDRFRKLIQDKIKQAEAAVNRIADNLKKNVKAALDLLSKGLDAALGLLQKGLMAAVDIAGKVVQGAIAAAKAAAEALGTFAVLIKDIASNPGQWISNLAAGVMDGIKNHLWGAFQTAIQEWFNQKLEEVLGLGLTVWNVLKQGGINLAEIGKMVWEGIKAAIPSLLIGILIEQVAKLIIPGLGAVMAIIESVQAAWGTVSRILQAMDRFVGFLKAVKSGAAGPLFGQLLAAAGVVLVDFVSNFLLKKVRGAASKVAGKIKAIAQKIGAKLKGAFAKVKKGAGKLKDNFFGKKDGKGNKDKSKAPKSPQDKEKAEFDKKQKKVDRAVQLAATAVNQFAGKSVGKVILIPILQSIKLSFGLKSLEPVRNGDNWAVHGKLNPTSIVITKARVQLGKGKVPKDGTIIDSSTTKKGEQKTQYLFANKNEAQNWAKKKLGQDAERIYDQKGKWIGWKNKKGESVYWGHNDWGKGVGLSTYPHLNYQIGGEKGHLFLENKIVNRGMAKDFMKDLGLEE